MEGEKVSGTNGTVGMLPARRLTFDGTEIVLRFPSRQVVFEIWPALAMMS